MRGTLTTFGALALLSACSEANAPIEPVTTIDAETPNPELSEVDPKPSNNVSEDGLVPVPFHGVWDGQYGKCRDYSDMRLVVHADGMQFYESEATVTRLDIVDEHTIRVETDMTGEGYEWQAAKTWTVSEDGTKLTRNDLDSDIDIGPVQYKKCPE